MKKTTALIFDHRNRAKEGQKGEIEVRVISDRHSYYFGTGVKVHRSEFVAGQIFNCAGADQLNTRIRIVYEKVNQIVNECISKNLPLNARTIRDSVWKEIEDSSHSDTLMEWIHKQITLLDMKEDTKKHYYTLESRLSEFGKMRRWEDVTIEHIYEFDAWLHTLIKPISDTAIRAGRRPEKLSDAGIYNYHKCLKALLNRADKMGKIERNPYDKLRGVFKRGDIENPEFLTYDEMLRIQNLDLSCGSVLDIARDLFVFQMFTGLAYSDAQAFDLSKYKKVDGTWKYIGKRIKTGVPYVSELLPPVVSVLEKYGGVVPKIGNADYNHRLKEIQRMTGIETRLHSHLARHSFATWMLANDAKIENVKRMLGHKSIVTTQRYAKVLATSVYEDYEKVKEKLF